LLQAEERLLQAEERLLHSNDVSKAYYQIINSRFWRYTKWLRIFLSRALRLFRLIRAYEWSKIKHTVKVHSINSIRSLGLMFAKIPFAKQLVKPVLRYFPKAEARLNSLINNSFSLREESVRGKKSTLSSRGVVVLHQLQAAIEKHKKGSL
jgi:hypothetical protein